MLHVIARIDRSSRARLSWIQSFAASFGIVPKPIYGHITLLSVDNAEESALLHTCRAALADQAAFSVDFTCVDILAGQPVVAVLAASGGVLDAVHEKLADTQEDWIPHIALLREEQMSLNWIRTAMGQMFQPFTAKVESIEIVRDTPGGFEVIGTVDLKGEGA